MTNGDIIRGMNDLQLALTIMCPKDLGFASESELSCNADENERNCAKCTHVWLQKEEKCENSLCEQVEQSEPKLPYTHLLLVNTCFEFKVYVVNTKDIFHTMGKFIYRSFEKVKRITFVEYTQVKLNYFKNESIPIYEFRNKYPYIKR